MEENAKHECQLIADELSNHLFTNKNQNISVVFRYMRSFEIVKNQEMNLYA